MAKKVNKGGAPSKWHDNIPDQAFKLSLLGYTDSELSAFFKVSLATWSNWKKNKPGFIETLKGGKDAIDSLVVHSLFQRAIGYETTEEKAMVVEGKVEIITIAKKYPPDVKAQERWLFNRQPKRWRDKQQDDTNTGNDIEKVAEALSKIADSLPG